MSVNNTFSVNNTIIKKDQHHEQLREANLHYQLVARAITYLNQNWSRQPDLTELAQQLHCSEYHLQRLFKRWAGISPKRFLQFISKEYLRQRLREDADLLLASHEAGLSGSGRLHDLMVTCEALTPGEIKSGGSGIDAYFGVADSPFGDVLLGWTQRGVCYLSFQENKHEGSDDDTVPEELKQHLPNANWQPDKNSAVELAVRIFHQTPQQDKPIHLLLKGTNFQIKVWQALIYSKPGQCHSYGQLARAVGQPGAARAVGSALARNNIGWLIPCHRVIRENAGINAYRWGQCRKQAILGWEMVRAGKD